MSAEDLAYKYGLTTEWVVDQYGNDIVAVRLDVVIRFLKALEASRVDS